VNRYPDRRPFSSSHRPDKAADVLAPVELLCQWRCEIGFTDVECYPKVFELGGL
jgi:hypothetical protein